MIGQAISSNSATPSRSSPIRASGSPRTMSPAGSAEREGTINMTDQTPSTDPGAEIDRQLGEILDRADRISTTTGGGAHLAREGLDRDLREIKDRVLRMGGLVEAAIIAALGALVEHDAAAAEAVI